MGLRGRASSACSPSTPTGPSRDVTRQAVTKTLDDSAATIDGKGKVKPRSAAETDQFRRPVRLARRLQPARVGTVINPDLKFDLRRCARGRTSIDDELLKRGSKR